MLPGGQLSEKHLLDLRVRVALREQYPREAEPGIELVQRRQVTFPRDIIRLEAVATLPDKCTRAMQPICQIPQQ
jgi:hypothetical protein